MRRWALSVAVVLAACDDFNSDLAKYCTVHPERCGDGGVGGAGGGSAGGSGGGSTGGSGGCGDFGAACTAEGQCCATTNINGVDYPLACGRIDYCELVRPDCRPAMTTCADAGQCCSHSCTQGRCEDCFGDNHPCDSALNCCAGSVCGTDGLCHVAGLGSGPLGGTCKSSTDCNLGWCQMDGGATGFCANPAMHTCTGLQGTPPPACCPGFNVSTFDSTCCQPAGTVCTSSFDCCVGGCYAGVCQDDASLLGGACDYTGDCQGLPFCDPVGRACVDRWCFKSVATPYEGCCKFSSTGTTCVFPDAGSCVLPSYQSATKEKCCSGQLNTDNLTCSSVVIYD